MIKNESLYGSSKSIFFILLVCFAFFKSQGQVNRNLVIVENLNQQWLIFDSEKNEFYPFVSEIFNPPYLHFALSLNKYDDYHLSIHVPENTSIFLENQIIDFSLESKTYFFSIDSLKQEYELEKILFTVFSERNLSHELETSIVDFHSSKGFDKSDVGLISEFREQNEFKNFNIIAVLIIFIIGTLVRNLQSNAFGEYFDYRKMIVLKPKSDMLYSISVLSLQNLSFLFLYGITMGYSFCNLIIWSNPSVFLKLGYIDTFGLVIIALIISLIFMLMMILKYPLVNIISKVFLFRQARTVHFFEYFRLSFFVAFAMLVSSIVNNFSDGQLLNSYMELIAKLLMILAIVRSVLVFLKLNNSKSFRKLHLFSYLCSTEIIPLIILLKLFKTYIVVF